MLSSGGEGVGEDVAALVHNTAVYGPGEAFGQCACGDESGGIVGAYLFRTVKGDGGGGECFYGKGVDVEVVGPVGIIVDGNVFGASRNGGCYLNPVF